MFQARTVHFAGARLLGALLLLCAGLLPAQAQQPSSDQVAAIRSSCRSDYIEHCSGVPTGGAAALNCLRQNEASLGAACRQAVGAVGGAPAAAAPPTTPSAAMPAHGDSMELFREDCGPDVRRLCRGALPGGGRVVDCLIENREHL